MTRWPLLLPLVLVLASSSEAWALKPAKHRELAEAACGDAGLPAQFCKRMGKQVYETDYLEWTDLSAHAQRERGQARCPAADAAITRVDTLAHAMVVDAHAGKLEAAAVDLGRALHTIQDECAHHGMTNEEHAFLSLEQTCDSGDFSPDILPDAIACAEARSRDVLQRAADALRDVSWAGVYDLCQSTNPNNDSSSTQDSCDLASLPTPHQACEFLALWKDWHGEDSRWNSDIVGARLLAAFSAGLASQSAPSACGGVATAIDLRTPAPTVTVSDQTCGFTDIACLGKVDEDGVPVDAAPESGGCSIGGGGGLPGAGLLLLALAAWRGPRRFRRR